MHLKRCAALAMACFPMLISGCGRGSAAPADHTRDLRAPNENRDLGAFFRDEVPTLACDFTVKNNSTKAVRFVETRPSCGCAGAELGALQLGRGEHTTLRVEVNTRGLGEQEKGVHCDLITEDGQIWRYGFRALLYPRVRIQPESLFLGSVEPLTPVERTVTLLSYTRADDEPSRPVDVRPDHEDVEASLPTRPEDTDKLAHGVIRRHFPMKVGLKPQNHAGPGRAEVEIIWNKGNESTRLTLPVVWRVDSLYVLDPPRAFFGNIGAHSAEPGSKPTMTIQISRSDERPFRVEGVSVPDASLSVRVETGRLRSEHSLEFELDASRVPRVLWGNVTVHTDHSLEREIVIPVSAIGGRVAVRAPNSGP